MGFNTDWSLVQSICDLHSIRHFDTYVPHIFCLAMTIFICLSRAGCIEVLYGWFCVNTICRIEARIGSKFAILFNNTILETNKSVHSAASSLLIRNCDQHCTGWLIPEKQRFAVFLTISTSHSSPSNVQYQRIVLLIALWFRTKGTYSRSLRSSHSHHIRAKIQDNWQSPNIIYWKLVIILPRGTSYAIDGSEKQELLYNYYSTE